MCNDEERVLGARPLRHRKTMMHAHNRVGSETHQYLVSTSHSFAHETYHNCLVLNITVSI